jgi:hypothetical protein
VVIHIAGYDALYRTVPCLCSSQSDCFPPSQVACCDSPCLLLDLLLFPLLIVNVISCTGCLTNIKTIKMVLSALCDAIDSATDGVQNVFFRWKHGSGVVDHVWFTSDITQGINKNADALTPIHALPPVPDDAFRIVCVSDTHNAHRRFRLPAADVLLHAGDVLMSSRRFSEQDSKSKIADFNAWLGEMSHIPHKIVIGGNHDEYLENLGAEKAKAALSNASFLVFEELCVTHPRFPESVRPLRVYGAPFSQGHSGNAAYQLRKDTDAAWEKGSRRIPPHRIPAAARHVPGAPMLPLYDVALTHAPFMTHFDLGTLPRAHCVPSGHVHVGGHLHAHHGARAVAGVPCVVACCLNHKYEARNPPIVFDYRPKSLHISDEHDALMR